MEQENWQRIRDIFADAVRQKPEVRQQFLETACDGNPDIHREVESLLSSYEIAGSFMESPAVVEVAESFGDGTPQLETGQTLGHYEISSQIGKGGMGEVYLASDKMLDRKVAIKVLFEKFGRDKENLQRIIREAKAASGLNHPNILVIHEIGKTENARYIVSEYIEGKTLREYSKDQTLKLSEVLNFSIQIAGALTAAHEAHLIHRDIKPENIMIRPDGIVKILDFGLAKLIEQKNRSLIDLEAKTKQQNQTAKGIILGTVNYMSPEQAKAKKIDERTDIFSFGVVLYEMITGSQPFASESTNETIAAILKSEPAPLSSHVQNVPKELERIVSKTLRKNPKKRYQHIKDLLIDLQELKQELEFEAKLERSVQPNLEKLERRESETIAMYNRDSVEQVATTAQQNISSAEYLASQVKQHKFGAGLILALAAIIIAGIGFGVYKFAGSSKSNISFESAKFTQVTSSGRSTKASISPDGNYIVHLMAEAGKESLWVRQTFTESNVQIVPPSEVRYWGITFSKDGNHIYYVTRDVGKPVGLLYRVPVLGGTPVMLVKDVDSPVTISPDGSQMAFLRFAAETNGIWIANVDGTAERQLAIRQAPEGLGKPAWSPDGKTVVCPMTGIGSGITGGDEVSFASVLAIRVSDGEQKQLTSKHWGYVGHIAWFNDDGLILNATEPNTRMGNPYSMWRFNSKQLWYVSYPDGQAKQITHDLHNYIDISLTADSSTLVTVQSDTQSNFFLVQAGDEEHSKQLTTSKGADGTSVSWTADGRILYDSLTSGNMDIWVMKADGSDQKRLTNDSNPDYSPIASADGRYIIFVSHRSGVGHVWRMNTDGSNPIQLTKGNIPKKFADIMPDGRWVVYMQGNGNKSELWKIPIEGGNPEQLGAYIKPLPIGTVVSPDGQNIAFWGWSLNLDSKVLGIMSFSGGAIAKTFELSPTAGFDVKPQFSADGRSILYVDSRNGVSNIWSQSLDGGRPKQITNFNTNRIFAFAYSPDGKQLAYTSGDTTSDVVLISGFKNEN